MFRNVSYARPKTYLALVTAAVADGDTGSSIVKPAGGRYSRALINPSGGSSPTWDLAASGLVDSTHLIQFAQATASWGTIVGVAICSASTGGDLLFYDNDMVDQAVGSGDTVEFPVGTLDLQMS
jgi:hypothetical protein